MIMIPTPIDNIMSDVEDSWVLLLQETSSNEARGLATRSRKYNHEPMTHFLG
jgi:hypothetical protein